MEETTNTVNAGSVPATQDEITQDENPVSAAIEDSPAEDMTQDEMALEEESSEGKKPGAAEKRIKQLLSKQKQA